MIGQDLLHALNSPEEVAGRGSGIGHLLTDSLEATLKCDTVPTPDKASTQGKPHGCGHSDGRGAPNNHFANGANDLSRCFTHHITFFEGKLALVYHDHIIILPGKGGYH